MNTIANASIPLKLFATFLTLALIAAAALAVTMTAGPTEAQNADNTFADPQPCGPALPDANYPDGPPITYSTGHLALFDGYWEADSESLNNNLCPPAIYTAIETIGSGREARQVEVTKRRTGDDVPNVDVRNTVIYLNDTFKVTVIDSGADDYVPGAVAGPTIDLAEYPFIEDVETGDKVWWLRLDDPDTTNIDETSGLQLSFSAALFDADYWYLEDGDGNSIAPLQYHYEAERHSNEPAEKAHFYAFAAPLAGNATQAKAIWNSAEAEATPMDMQPGQYRDVQWVFTGAGTHRLGVHIQGHIRLNKDNPYAAGTAEHNNWQPLTDGSHSRIVTSEVKRYVIHVGDELTVNHDPLFLIERSVAENSPVGAAVGDPIAVHDPDGDPLSYRISGPDSELFALSGNTDGDGRFTEPPRIVVAANALDHEARPHHFVTLHVSDRKGRTSYADHEPDGAVAVKINVTNVDETDVGISGEGLRLVPSATRLKAGETATLRAVIGDLPAGAANLHLRWSVEDPAGTDPVRSPAGQDYSRGFAYDTPGTRAFSVGLFYTVDGERRAGHRSDRITVTWTNDGS